MVGMLDEMSRSVDEDNRDLLVDAAPSIFGELSVPGGIGLMNLGQFDEVDAGKIFIRQGQPQSDLVIVLSGELKVHCQANGQTIQLANLGAGETVGEIGMLDRGNASATVTTMEATLVWSLERSAFERFLQEHPGDGIRLFWVLSGKLCKRLRWSSERMLKQAERVRLSYLDCDY